MAKKKAKKKVLKKKVKKTAGRIIGDQWSDKDRKKMKKGPKLKINKISPKKATKKRSGKKLDPLKQLYGRLHAKKLAIMAAVPVMPCSAINKDRHGCIYHHTQASKVFYIYGQEMIKYGLVMRMIKCEMSEAHHTIDRMTGNEKDGFVWETKEILCSRAVCTFRIADTETGEYEDFMASGLGDNEVWSDTSALTVAFKEALLLYFHTSWPETNTTLKIIQEQLKELKGTDVVKAVEKIMPPKVLEILTAAGAMEQLRKHFGN